MSEAARVLEQIERIFTNAPREVERVSRVLNAGAGAARSVAAALEPAVRLYRQTHGGQDPRREEYVEVPDEEGGPLVELGRLTAVAYLTNKDRVSKQSGSRWVEPKAKRPDLYIHDFERPYPVLAFRTESRDIVIVRGADRSRYTVGEEGIDG